ncbi:unnamed protein product [Trichobilharzia szidati]|nr:unnamed protein product [Trichobilharzia szidati]
MPALVFLGRAWAFASDDFVCTGLSNFLLRLSCVCIMAVPLLLAKNVSVCFSDIASKVFCIAMFVVMAVLLILDALLSLFSSKGGVMDTNLRRNVPHVLGTVCLFSLVLLVLNCINLYFAYNAYNLCEIQIIDCYVAGNAISVAHVIGFILFLLLHYREAGAFWGQLANDPNVFKQGCLHPDVNLSTKQSVMLKKRKSFQRNLRILGVFRRSPRFKTDQTLVQTEERVITSAAALFSEIFYDVDLVASDIVAGLILLRWQTKQWVGCGHRVPLSLIHQDTSPSDLNIHAVQKDDQTPDMWLDIHRIYRVAEFVTAIYGKLLYYSMNLGIPGSTCRLYRHLPCCINSCNRPSPEQSQLSCCICSGHTCDLAAILEFTSLREDQFVKLSYDNSVHQTPYFVAIDDCSQCIVISVRGTLSFEDTIVDLLYDGVRLDEVETFIESKTGTRPCFIGHRGMVERSRYLYNCLVADRTIDIALHRKPHYKLVVCGHSLGAGIASFLSVFLRSTYPDVKGYAFSAPLGMMNQELADYCKPFLLSIIYGYDIFARMNRSTMSDFKWRLLDALSACKVPKHRLLSRGLFVCLRRYLFKWCFPDCFPSESVTTVGNDTLLLDATTQERLIQSIPQLAHDDNEMRVCLSSQENSSNSASTSTYRTVQSNRFRPGPRSLLCWINPDSVLPQTNIQPTESTSQMHSANDKADLSTTDELQSCQSYDLSDGVFGGLVLHLVDVDLDQSDDDDSSTSPMMNENSFKEDVKDGRKIHNSGLERLLSAKSSRKNSCCKSHRETRRTVSAVWSNPQQFKTILIHPQMLIHHLPDRVLKAVECLRRTVLLVSTDSSEKNGMNGLKTCDFIRKLNNVS